MEKGFWCVHHVLDGMETVAPCSSREMAKKLAGAYRSRGGKVFIVFEKKEIKEASNDKFVYQKSQ